MQKVEHRVDVTDAVGLGEALSTAVTVCLPDRVPARPVVCFAFPGGGYNRHYFSFSHPEDVDGLDPDGQAGWHTDRGWIFVAADHLHCGDSTRVSKPEQITFEHMGAANAATTERVMELLRAGDLVNDLAPVVEPVVLGIGQSMGGSTIILQQGQRASFDGIGVLGWSASHSVSWLSPEKPKPAIPYFPRGTNVGALTQEVYTAAMPEMGLRADGLPKVTPGFHYDDVSRDLVVLDMTDYPHRGATPPEWATNAIPPCAMTMMSPGAVAPEAAAITVPILVAVGERDVVPDPKGESRAYERAVDVSLYICPRMSHMHNFATTRTQFWARIHAWGEGVAAVQRSSDIRTDRLVPV